jgi:hypothetical protein
MPPSSSTTTTSVPEPVEFSVEDAMLETWVEDTSVYLRLDPPELTPLDTPLPDQS